MNASPGPGESGDGGGADSLRPESRSQRHAPAVITLSGEARVPRWASPWWLLFLGLSLAEVVALFVRIERVPSDADWQRASAFVREQLESSDAISVAPSWADPLLRLHLGDRITPKMAGRYDLAAFERLWVLSIRGARSSEAPARPPDVSRAFGRVTVSRYDFGPTAVVLDLADALPSAKVEFDQDGSSMPCEWRERVGGPSRGGLGFGPVSPRQRFVCDERRTYLWVGTTIIEDMTMSPRRCIWQHPQGKAPVSVTFEGVHLGQKLVLYGGLFYLDERGEQGAPVTLRVLVDGHEAARMVHRDGEGMKRLEIATHPKGLPIGVRGNLRFEVTAPDSGGRSFCWSGSIRDATRREAP